MDCPSSSRPSLVPRPPARPKLPTKAKLEIDVVNIESLNSGASVKAFHDKVVEFICGRSGRGKRRKFIRWCRDHVDIDKYIVFLKFKLNKEEITLLLRGFDIYIGGFMLGNGDCFLFDHQMKKFVSWEDYETFVACEENSASMLPPPPDSNYFVKCLKEHGMEGLYTLPFGDSYGQIEGAAGMQRGDVILGKKELEDAFKTLASYNKSETVEELKEVAKALLFFTQFLSEAVRVIPQSKTIADAFTTGERVTIPYWMILLHHGWGFASLCMRRIRSNKSLQGYELRYEENDYIISTSEMEFLFRAFLEGKTKGKKKKIILEEVYNAGSGRA